MKNHRVVIWSLGLLALGCAPTETGGTGGNGSSGTAGTTGSAGAQATAGTTGSAGSTATAGTTGSAGSAATAGTTGSAGSTATAGTTGSAGSGATAGTTGTAGTSGAAGRGGTTGSAGATGSAGRGGTTGTAGAAGGAAGRGGTTGTAGAAGGAAGRGGTTGTAGTTGAGGGVTVSSTCTMPTWPTASGSVTISGTMSVTNYDGQMRTVQGNLDNCSSAGQSSTNAIFEVADGGSVRNVIFGTSIGDGIHCSGSCTIENVWFPYICDDAITMLGGSGKTMTVRNSGFKGARDKVVQHNGNGSTVNLENIYVETAGKLYRSCGEGSGCGSASAVRTVNATNIYAIGVGQVLGVSSNDRATLKNICAYRTPQVCHVYQPGSDADAPVGANGVGEGPSANCTYTAADTHALVNRVNGSLSTDVLCTGPNSAKTGSTATACVSGFNTCLKGCAPGSYGFKQLICSGSMYAEAAGGCVPPTDATAAAGLASSKSSTATSTVTGNAACTTQWNWGKDSDGKFCVCVMKPGYYQESNGWYVWDCQTQWW